MRYRHFITSKETNKEFTLTAADALLSDNEVTLPTRDLQLTPFLHPNLSFALVKPDFLERIRNETDKTG